MWEAHHNRGRLTSPNDVASDMKDRICRRSSRNVCTECDIVTFSKSRHFELAKPRKGLHYLWIHSTNLRPSGPEVLKDALAFICQKSGHGGAHVTRTNVLLGHCTLRASATLVGSVVRASPCCTTPGWRAFTACRHAWSSSFQRETGQTPRSNKDWWAEEIPSKKLNRANGLRRACALVPEPAHWGLGTKPTLRGSWVA